MRILSLIAAVVLLGCGAAHAQSVMTVPGMGATSPLSVLGSSASSGSNSATGIPLGATEIDPGGLSPAPMSNASASSATSSGTASPLSPTTTNSNFTLNGGTIPLGSTELDSAGVSPLITAPMFNGAMPSCAGSTIASSGAAMGSTSAGTVPSGC